MDIIHLKIWESPGIANRLYIFSHKNSNSNKLLTRGYNLNFQVLDAVEIDFYKTLMRKNSSQYTFWRFATTVLAFIVGLAAWEIGNRLLDLGVVFSIGTFWWSVVCVLGIFSTATLIFAWTPLLPRFSVKFSKFHQIYWSRQDLLSWLGILVLALIFSLWVLTRGYLVLNGFFARVLIFSIVAILGAFFMRPLTPEGNWKIALGGSMLVIAVVFKVLIYFIPTVSASPFSLSWSEGSRYYYGSLFLSNRVYGLDIPPSPWHASRYLLLSIPFLVPDSPIWIHRLWQAFLWVGLSGFGGYLFAKRLKIQRKFFVFLVLLWSFLLLNLGPVYYHLMVCVILVTWGTDFDKPVKTSATLVLSSIWAGLSRINWAPVPAFLVISFYFLEIPWDKTKKGWKYFLQPVLFGLGIVPAILSYLIYLNYSGNEASKFGSSFTSDLLWNRLWPNSTYSFGILLAVLIISIPMWLIIGLRLRENPSQRTWLKWVLFVLMLAILFVGGLVVSVKIGGGSNLHNMDAYFVLLLTFTVYLFWKRDVYDINHGKVFQEKVTPKWIVTLAVTIPILLTIREGWVVTPPDLNQDRSDLQRLEKWVSDESSTGGEVLFITERQVQVFHQNPEIQFVPEYEKLELMEMAMSGNTFYLDKFHNDIENHRFSLIVLDAIRLDKKDRTEAFSEEHNVWVEEVILPLLKSYDYTPLGTRRDINLLTLKN